MNVSAEKTMSENRNLSSNHAAAQAILEKLERDGILVTEYAMCQAVLEYLEREGVLVKNGKYRPGEGGILEPVYVAVEYAKQPAKAEAMTILATIAAKLLR